MGGRGAKLKATQSVAGGIGGALRRGLARLARAVKSGVRAVRARLTSFNKKGGPTPVQKRALQTRVAQLNNRVSRSQRLARLEDNLRLPRQGRQSTAKSGGIVRGITNLLRGLTRSVRGAKTKE